MSRRKASISDNLAMATQQSTELFSAPTTTYGLLERFHLRWIQRWLWNNREPAIVVSLLFVACAVFRGLVLFQWPYPTSGDVGGDLYFAHVWLGHSLPGLHQPLEPPLYYFLIVIPFTQAFPVFYGETLYMSIVPALLVYPGYILALTSGAGRRWSYVGAALFGTSASLGLMDTWNAGFNLLGIFFLMFFLVALTEFLRHRLTRNLVGVGVTFGLVVGTHPLSAFIAVLGAVAILLIWLSTARDRFRQRLGGVVRVTLACVLGALPFVPIYLSLVQGGFATVPTNSQVSLDWFLRTVLFYPWGYQNLTSNPLAIVDAAISIVAIMFYLRNGDRTFGIVNTGMLFGALAYPLISPANAARGLYFVFIPLAACIPFFFSELYRRFGRQSGPVTHTPGSSRHWAMSVPRPARIVVRVAAVAIVVTFLAANGSASESLFESGAAHYQSLNSQILSAIRWAEANTSAASTFFIASSLAVATPWFWSLANRVAFAPADVSIEATSFSAFVAQTADYISIGNYVLADGSIAVGYGFPGPESAPDVFFQYDGAWYPLLYFNAGDQFFNLSQNSNGHLVTKLELASGTLSDVSTSTSSSEASTTFSFWWTAYDVGLTLHARLSGQGLLMNWTSNTSRILSFNNAFQLLPSSYGFYYTSVSNAYQASDLNDSFTSYAALPITLSMSGGNFSQVTLPDGWTDIDDLGSENMSLQLGGSGLTSLEVPTTMNATVLLHELNINYIVLNPSYDYTLFTRERSNIPAITGLVYNMVFSNGEIAIYQVTYL